MDKGYVAGLMSGTSMDGVDCAIIDVEGRFVAGHTMPYPTALANKLKALSANTTIDLPSYFECDAWVGECFATAVLDLVERSGIVLDSLACIGSHGQTIHHDLYATVPYTLQIGAPHRIAHLTGVPVVADFRTRDLLLGGTGAPFAPWYHGRLFNALPKPMAIINIGGIANITWLTERGATGYDVGPGNCLMDDWICYQRGEAYDKNGQFSAEGQADLRLVKAMYADPYFKRPSPKSIGREYFSLEWLAKHVVGHESPADVQASLMYLTAYSLADAIQSAPLPTEVLLCGGGVHNLALIAKLRELLPGISISSTDKYGVSPDYLEAMMFAALGALFMKGECIDMTQITGASTPARLGALYPSTGVRPIA